MLPMPVQPKSVTLYDKITASGEACDIRAYFLGTSFLCASVEKRELHRPLIGVLPVMRLPGPKTLRTLYREVVTHNS